MNKQNALTLSIIIPAYNEERHIRACLASIAKQTVVPDEVLLVDNNCTDQTVAIAREFSFVRVIKEKKQGLIAARNAGFTAATSQLLARIDCDAKLAPDWVARAKAAFEDPKTAAVTGLARTCVIPYLPWPRSSLWARLYFFDTPAFFRVPLLWGSNMAMRTSAWRVIKKQVCLDDAVVHEDQDMSILLAAHGLHIKLDNKLCINTGGEQFGYLPKVWEYSRRRASTRDHHEQQGTLQLARAHAAMKSSTIYRRYLLIIPGLFFMVIALFDTLVQLIFGREQ